MHVFTLRLHSETKGSAACENGKCGSCFKLHRAASLMELLSDFLRDCHASVVRSLGSGRAFA